MLDFKFYFAKFALLSPPNLFIYLRIQIRRPWAVASMNSAWVGCIIVALAIICNCLSMVCSDGEYQSSLTRLYLLSSSGLDVFKCINGFPSSVPMVSIDVRSLGHIHRPPQDKKFALRVDIIPFFLGFVRHHRRHYGRISSGDP